MATRLHDKHFVIQIFYDGYKKRTSIIDSFELISIDKAKQALQYLKNYIENNTQNDIDKRNNQREHFYVEHFLPKKSNNRFEKKGKVYLMHNTRSNEYKIGFTTKHPNFRLREFKLVDPNVEYLFSFNSTMQQEKKLHNQFAQKRLRGEWFALNEDDINYIKKYVAENIYDEPTN